MWLCKKKYKPRIKGILKVKTLQSQLEAMEKISSQLKADKDKSMQQVQMLKQQMQNVIYKIKTAPVLLEKDIKKLYNDLFAAFDTDLKKLKALLEQQKNRDEQERLKKLQEEIEKAKRQKEEEEKQKELEDKQRKQKVEIEARRKTEAELAKKLEKENEKNQAELDKRMQIELEEQKRQQRILEQEKLDYDLAIRLAPEINGEVEPMNAVKK
jgi:myosin VI